MQTIPAEKLTLVEELHDDVAAIPELIPVRDWQKEELARRKSRFMKNPNVGLSWVEAMRRVQSHHDH